MNNYGINKIKSSNISELKIIAIAFYIFVHNCNIDSSKVILKSGNCLL